LNYRRIDFGSVKKSFQARCFSGVEDEEEDDDEDDEDEELPAASAVPLT
jgi:hypothetical protein